MKWIHLIGSVLIFLLLMQGERMWWALPVTWMCLLYTIYHSRVPVWVSLGLCAMLDVFLDLPLGITSVVIGVILTLSEPPIAMGRYRWVWIICLGAGLGCLYASLRHLNPLTLSIQTSIATALVLWRKDTLLVREIGHVN